MIRGMENGQTLNSDKALLDASPSYLSIGDMFKATPHTEGDKRFIYMEASNEVRDLQDEMVLQKALTDSAEYFLRFGNIDIDHYTKIGVPNPQKGYIGIPNFELYEIGRPIDVRADGKSTFVKALINSGSGIAAEKANSFWSSITELNPPKRWYPSVGGSVLEKSIAIDEKTSEKYSVITKVRWNNVGFSLQPVNQTVQEVSTIPIGVLAKSWGVLGLDLRKSLEAGYNSNAATMTGGDALRVQSLDHQKGGVLEYDLFKNEFAKLINSGEIGHGVKNMVLEAASRFQYSKSKAAEYVERFLNDLKRGLKEKS